MKRSIDIYTLGTSNQTLDEFFALLDAYSVSRIVDVRRFPKSSRFPHFDRENLALEMEHRGLSYHWLGELLGGFRKGGYEQYKREASYLKGLEEVEHLAGKSTIALICAEKLPWKCHRLKISESLKARGWNVVHIIDRDRTWQPGPTLFENSLHP